MSLNRMPLFCFAILAAAFALLFALPPLTVDCVFLELQRKAGFHFFDVADGGDPLLWQYLFWIFGHPEVYIIVLPAFGIATSIIPTFARRRMVAFPLVAMAELLVVFIGFGVWAHHMFATGLTTVTLIFFASASMMVVIPSTIQIFAWLMTVTMGTPGFRAPLLFIGGFIVFFVLGGLTGIMFAAIPFDQALTDTYFVVAHFHFVIFGAAVFPLLGGLYYWFPKVTGRMYHEGWAKAWFWLTFAGTMLTFFPMHIAGLLGMTRRVYTYEPGLGLGIYNLPETIGGFVLAAGLLLIAANLLWSARTGPPAGPGPVLRRHARVDGPLAAAPLQLRGHPDGASPYPNWDAEDAHGGRQESSSLDGGHETPASSVADGRFDEVAAMPAESPWPIVLAASRRGRVRAAPDVPFHRRRRVLRTRGPVPRRAGTGRSPRTMTPDASVRMRGAAEPARPNGWWGMALFVATEATLFGAARRHLCLPPRAARTCGRRPASRARRSPPRCS